MIQIDTLGHISFLIVVISYAMKDIIVLRILGILSAIIGISYNYFIELGPLWIPIFWLSSFIFINLYMISFFYLENRKSNLTSEELEIWKSNFLGLTISEYKLINKICTSKTFISGDVLINFGVKSKFLYFVNSGKLSVKRSEDVLNTLSQGDVAGEISFITDSLPNADVIAMEETRCIMVDKTKLKAIMRTKPTLQLSISNLLNLNLSKKLS